MGIVFTTPCDLRRSTGAGEGSRERCRIAKGDESSRKERHGFLLMYPLPASLSWMDALQTCARDTLRPVDVDEPAEVALCIIGLSC